MNLSDATYKANLLLSHLSSACVRCEIAGSIRRAKSDVKDIEIVCIPKPRGRPQFGDAKPFKTELDALLYQLCESPASPFPLKQLKSGDKYKKLSLVKADINLDLFIVTPPAQWGVQFVIRTGPSDFSQWVVTQRFKGGALPDGYYVESGAVWRILTDSVGDELVEMPEERDFLRFLELGWIDPSKREARWRQFEKAAVEV